MPSRDPGHFLAAALPTDRDDELVRRFQVTLNYLRDLQNYVANVYGRGRKVYPGLSEALEMQSAYLKLQRRRAGAVDLDQLQRHLEIAWVTELVLRMPAALGQGRALRVTNAWAPVHAYYAVNMALQAWFDANGMTGIADDHTATLRSIAAQIKDRRLFPEPWSVLCVGNPFVRDGCSYVNEPTPGACSAKIEVLSMPIGLPGAFSEVEFLARFGTWLRTTREARLRKREEAWKQKQRRSRIDPKVRKQYVASLHPTSLFDCLWRLRIRSNYRSVETYLVRYVSESDAELFHKALVVITTSTLCLLECYVARLIGAANYGRIADRFVSGDQTGLAEQTVGTRWPHVSAAASTSGHRH
jgi:hypothetical protein